MLPSVHHDPGSKCSSDDARKFNSQKGENEIREGDLTKIIKRKET